MSWRSTFEGLMYKILSPLLLYKSKSTHKPVVLSVSGLADEEIIQLAYQSPKVNENTYIDGLTGEPNTGNVSRIAPDTVVKISIECKPAELLSMELVQTRTAIPVPLPERLIHASLSHRYMLVQQFIPGHVLMDVWQQLSWWMRLRVALTLRFYVHELRCLSTRVAAPSFPGPPSSDGQPQECTGHLFNSEGSGPFSSYREMSRWYQNRLLVMQRWRGEGLDSAPFDDTAPLVFTHFDLHMRNIILGDDGQLWLIDWADSGWYPSWFEAASMTILAKHHPSMPSSWAALISFIAGSCKKPGQLPFIFAISYSLDVLGANIVNLIDSETQRGD